MFDHPQDAQSKEAIHAHLLTMGGWIKRRDVDKLAGQCAIPFAAYIQGEIVVVSSVDVLRALYGSHCDAINDPGEYAARFDLVSVQDQGRGRHMAIAVWHLTYTGSGKVVVLTTRYMFRICAESRHITLEMLEDLTPQETEISALAKSYSARRAPAG